MIANCPGSMRACSATVHLPLSNDRLELYVLTATRRALMEGVVCMLTQFQWMAAVPVGS